MRAILMRAMTMKSLNLACVGAAHVWLASKVAALLLTHEAPAGSLDRLDHLAAPDHGWWHVSHLPQAQGPSTPPH